MTSATTTSQASALTFDVYQSSSCLKIYKYERKTIAYTAVKTSGFTNPFSKIPTLTIYQGQGPAELESKRVASSSNTKSLPEHEPIATAHVARYTTSISLTVDGRSIDVPSHTTGLWKYARGWETSQGVTRWKYGRFSSAMDLAAEDGTMLGQWQTSQGDAGKIAKLWICDVEDKDRVQWLDETISIALAIYVAKQRRR
ncbi:MAG: hypothetical protein Q9222_002821 [Ikaeria aurantiellina]